MARRVLGLDIGSYSLKAAVLQTTFQAFQITDLYESRPLRLDEMSREEALPAMQKALQDFIAENQLQAELVITALSGAKVSHRALQLPLRDRKQIEKVLPFELEGFLPFAMEQLLVDYDVSQSSKAGTHLLAFAVKRDFLEQHLAYFNGLSFTPEIVDVDVLALGNMAHVSNLPATGLSALLDIGHTKSSLAIIKSGKTIAIRTFLTAGQHITDALRLNLDLTMQQAEEVKHKYGVVHPDLSSLRDSQQQKIARVIAEVLTPMLMEVNQTLHNVEAVDTESLKVDSLFISGGSALIRNIDVWIGSILSRSVTFAHCIHQGIPLETKIGKKEPVMLQAIGLGLRSGIRGVSATRLSQLNLRKGDYALAKDYSAIKGRLAGYALWLGIILALAFGEYLAKYWTLSSQSEQIEKQIVSSIQKIVPDVPKSKLRSSKQAMQVVQSRMIDFQKKVALLTSGLKGVTALDILREVSERIPKSIPVDIREMSIDQSKVYLKGDTDSFTSFDKMVTFIEKYEKFVKIDKGPIADTADGTHKRFSITIVVGDKDEESSR